MADNLTKVLEPFAKAAWCINPDLPDGTEVSLSIGGQAVYHVALGSLRAARAAIAALPPSNSLEGGRSPSEPGSRASHEAASCTASSPEASIPNAALVYAVTRVMGEYSDRSETAAAVFANEADAKQFVEAASSQAREAEKRFPVDYTTYDGGETIKLRQSVMTLDPDGADDYDTPCYYCAPCAFFASFASAIEAREGGRTNEPAERAAVQPDTPDSEGA